MNTAILRTPSGSSLRRIGKCDIFIGDTNDQVNCSRLAARMSGLTGKPVVARRG